VFITPTHYLRLLESMPLLVISEGMRQRAEQLGFTRIIQAENATVTAIKNALVTFLAS
jgi:uroporphyrinogen-III synthase